MIIFKLNKLKCLWILLKENPGGIRLKKRKEKKVEREKEKKERKTQKKEEKEKEKSSGKYSVSSVSSFIFQ